VGQGLLITEVSRSHPDTPHSVGLLWTGDKPELTTHNTQNRKIFMTPAGIESAIPITEKPKAHNSYGAATGIEPCVYTVKLNYIQIKHE